MKIYRIQLWGARDGYHEYIWCESLRKANATIRELRKNDNSQRLRVDCVVVTSTKEGIVDALNTYAG